MPWFLYLNHHAFGFDKLVQKSIIFKTVILTKASFIAILDIIDTGLLLYKVISSMLDRLNCYKHFSIFM